MTDFARRTLHEVVRTMPSRALWIAGLTFATIVIDGISGNRLRPLIEWLVQFTSIWN